MLGNEWPIVMEHRWKEYEETFNNHRLRRNGHSEAAQRLGWSRRAAGGC